MRHGRSASILSDRSISHLVEDLGAPLGNLLDEEVAQHMFGTCEYSVVELHIDSFVVDRPGKSRALFQALEESYGVMAHRTILGLALEFFSSKCQEGGDVEVWMDTVSAKHQALKDANFTVEDMAVVVLLKGLPPRFSHCVDQILINNDRVPKLDAVKRAIRAVNEAQQFRKETDQSVTAPKVLSKAGRKKRNGKIKALEESGERYAQFLSNSSLSSGP